MLTHLELRNFKCFDEVKLYLKPRINVFIGPNGSGKSSVLQALALLKQSLGKSEGLKPFGPYLFVRRFDDLRCVSSNNKTFSIAIQGTVHVPDSWVPGCPTRYDYLRYSETVEFSCDELGEVKDQRCQIKAPLPNDPSQALWHIPERGPAHEEPIVQPVGNIASPPNFVVNLAVGRPFSFYGPPEPNWERVLGVIEGELKKLTVVMVKRGVQRSHLSLGDNPTEDFAQSEENFATTLVYEAAVTTKVSKWVKCVTGVGIEGRTEPGRLAVPKAVRGAARNDLIHEGFGSNQLAWLLASLARAQRVALLRLRSRRYTSIQNHNSN
ncbi:MAG: AAA family ATPase [Chloroflexi bacterium]|nr:AAA family ATPase [Chloroflexota bacterium]